MDNNLHLGGSGAKKNPVQPDSRVGSKPSILVGAVATFVITLVVMALFELVKQLLHPRITIWQSHTITICFTAIVAFLVSLIVLKRFRSRLLAEMAIREAAEANRKQSEDALRDSEDRFVKAFRSSPDGITISTVPECRYAEANDAFLSLTEYQRPELIGKTGLELNLWVDPEECGVLIDKLIIRGAIRDEEVNLRTKSGKIRQVQLAGEHIQLEGEWCLLIITRDVTERKALEHQLQQAQKMDAIGHLAGGIAHDFNNLLGVILMSCELLLETMSPEDPLREKISAIHGTGLRAAALTRQLLAFSRQQVLQPRMLELNQIVIGARDLLHQLIREDIELINVLDPCLGKFKADPVQIEQVIMNLVVNARDAMPAGGTLTIETKSVYVDASYPDLHSIQKPGPYVLLAVSDTGMGMDQEIQSHIFEPFFTTKEFGKGTGLGLSTVYGIVRQSEGLIWVYSEPGKGTTFKIYFPQVDAMQPVRLGGTPEELTTAATTLTTVMVVEDEEFLRRLTCESLRTSGFKVLEAETPEAAIRIVEEGAQIHVLLTDIVMPKMSGAELAKQVQSTCPQIKVIYMSGYTQGVIAQQGVMGGGHGFLQKPFSRTEVLRKIREVMDGTTEN